MRTGLLWFDNSEKRSLDEKITKAVEYYSAKHGSQPSVCYVHPSMLLGATPRLSGVVVRGTNMVLPNHFWLGFDEEARRPVN